MAAAGAAPGALGLARPAASGSRWRRKPARQDFSRIPEARRIIGMAAAVRESLATEAIRARTAASIAPASAAVASAVRPAEPKATDGPGRAPNRCVTAPNRCVTARSSPASITSTLPTDVTALGSRHFPYYQAYAVLPKLADGGQQAIHLGLVVVVDEPGPDRAAGVPQAERPGQFPRVVVAVPYVDRPRREALGHLPRRVPGHGEERRR